MKDEMSELQVSLKKAIGGRKESEQKVRMVCNYIWLSLCKLSKERNVDITTLRRSLF